MIDLHAEFEKHADEYGKFDRVENPLHPCPDICALLLLHRLAPLMPGRDMIGGATDDVIWLDVDLKELAKVATTDDILTLARCGVMYDEDDGGLSMFV